MNADILTLTASNDSSWDRLFKNLVYFDALFVDNFDHVAFVVKSPGKDSGTVKVLLHDAHRIFVDGDEITVSLVASIRNFRSKKFLI